MRISTRGRYSLETLLYLALLPQGETASIRTISQATGISAGYLEQLCIPLRNAGILRSIRGHKGGYFPGKPLEEISVGDILRIAEGSLEPVSCVQSTECSSSVTCLSRNTWVDLFEEINSCVNEISLQELALTCLENSPSYGGTT